MLPLGKKLPKMTSHKELLKKLMSQISNIDSDSDISLLPQTQVDEDLSHASVTASKLPQAPSLLAFSLMSLKPPSLRHPSLNFLPCQPARQPAIQPASKPVSKRGRRIKKIPLWDTEAMLVFWCSLLSMHEIGEDPIKDPTWERLEDQQPENTSAPEGVAVVLPADPPTSAIFYSEQEEMLVDWFIDQPLFYNQ